MTENNGGNRIKLRLSQQAERYARRDAPVEIRRTAARGALPLEPIELATVLFVLMHDGDAEVKDTARTSLEQLPRPLLETVVGGAAHPALLSLLARIHRDDEALGASLALNPACDDATVAFLATLPLRQVVDIVSHNQERMMRCDDIVEAGYVALSMRLNDYIAQCPAYQINVAGRTGVNKSCEQALLVQPKLHRN